MAQTRRRRRKHRGTQSGSIDRRRASRPRSRQEARARAKKQMGTKREGPPGWGTAVTRGLFGAGVFLLLLVLIFRRPVLPSVALSLFMLLIYIPLGHYIDQFMFNRRQAAKRRERERHLRGE
jgi:Flp pilus assembly protein TadB